MARATIVYDDMSDPSNPGYVLTTESARGEDREVLDAETLADAITEAAVYLDWPAEWFERRRQPSGAEVAVAEALGE